MVADIGSHALGADTCTTVGAGRNCLTVHSTDLTVVALHRSLLARYMTAFTEPGIASWDNPRPAANSAARKRFQSTGGNHGGDLQRCFRAHGSSHCRDVTNGRPRPRLQRVCVRIAHLSSRVPTFEN